MNGHRSFDGEKTKEGRRLQQANSDGIILRNFNDAGECGMSLLIIMKIFADVNDFVGVSVLGIEVVLLILGISEGIKPGKVFRRPACLSPVGNLHSIHITISIHTTAF
jgi:hypothetical protein